MAVAGALLCLVSVFLVGFFIGQRSATQQLVDRAGQGAFADHIYAAMCGLSGTDEQHEESDTAGGEAEVSGEEHTQQSSGSAAVTADEAGEVATDEAEASESCSEYYAQLIGFGAAKTAQDYANRLKRKGVPVFVQKRHSRSAKGRLVTWYQVVTEKFRDEEKLQALIARLKKEEKLQGIHVVAC